MRRTKQWWQGLDEEERSRIVFYEYALRHPTSMIPCAACLTLKQGDDALCNRCRKEYNRLLEKADHAFVLR